MDIRIGISNSAREISLESSQTPAEVEKIVLDVLESGAPVLRLADEKGRIFLVPTSTLAYVEIGSEESRRVGFVA